MARGRDRRRETRILPLTVRLADVPPEFKSELFDGMRDAGLDVATLPADTVDAETFAALIGGAEWELASDDALRRGLVAAGFLGATDAAETCEREMARRLTDTPLAERARALFGHADDFDKATRDAIDEVATDDDVVPLSGVTTVTEAVANNETLWRIRARLRRACLPELEFIDAVCTARMLLMMPLSSFSDII